MNAENITATITALTALVVAIGGLVTVLAKLKSAAADRAVATTKLDEVHAAIVPASGEKVVRQ